MFTASLLVFGAGHMGSAIVAGAARVFRGDARVGVVEPDNARRERFSASPSVAVFPDTRSGLAWLAPRGPSGQVLLAVKPQALRDLAADLSGLLGDRVVISILAGTPGAKVRALLPSARVVRAMPNLPVSIGRGMTAVCPSAGARPGDEEAALTLFRATGDVVTIDESLMDAFTALAGSGPAYLFHLARAMERAGVAMGFDPAAAARVTRGTLAGAAELLARSPEDAGVLCASVTSKGGTTQAALDVLRARAVEDALIEAILAARNRGAELARD